ncbi:Crp/Fnr family transcriptional regulator, partial [Microvirga sp. KLBC 81]|uniref:Crp/Fnr family transcriptional regulator n=1 Tax=Microvirga sp. KLBC 81 TaxID=1862707 RepID=UPI000D51EE55
DDFAFLEPHLEMVSLPKGTVVYETGDLMPYAYFPHDSIVALITVLADGKTVEMAVFGREAVFGLASALVTRQALGRYVVHVTGRASRIDMNILHQAFDTRPVLREMCLRFVEALLAQAFYSMACNTVHSVEARCCRWILSMQDRVGRSTLPLTHEHLAEMLGVQRSTVSIVVRALQTAGLIRQGRGLITVTDRQGLENTVCECYAITRNRFERLLPHTFQND